MMKYNTKELIEIFKEHYAEYYNKMNDCSHYYKGIVPNKYHLEGSIWEHTLLVLKECEKKKETISEQNYKILSLTCLLHDIGKPYVAKDIDESKRRRFINHYNFSYYIICDMIDNNHFGYTREEMMLVALLALNHHNGFESEYCYVNNEKFCYLLNLLASCDDAGRVVSEEMKDIKLKDTILNKSTFNHSGDRELLFLIGPPCSGKNTMLKTNTFTDYEILSKDDIMQELTEEENYNEAWKKQDRQQVNEVFNERLTNYYIDKKNVIINNCNCHRKARNEIVKNKNIKNCILMMVGYNELLDRDAKRENKDIGKTIIDGFIEGLSFRFNKEFNLVRFAYKNNLFTMNDIFEGVYQKCY